MKLITHILQLVAVISILLSSWIFVADTTLFNAKYIQAQAKESGFYTAVTKSLPDLISPGGTPEAILLHQILQETLTTGYVRTKFDKLVEQLQAYYLGNGPAPTLDLAEIRTQAAAAGIPLPAGSLPIQPLTLGNASAQTTIHALKSYQPWALLAAALSLVLIFLTSHHGRRFSHLGTTLILAALGEGVLYLVFRSVPGSLLGSLTSSHQMAAIAPSLQKLGQSVSAGASNQFGIIGIALALAGIGCYIVNAALSIGHHLHIGGHKEGHGH